MNLSLAKHTLSTAASFRQPDVLPCKKEVIINNTHFQGLPKTSRVRTNYKLRVGEKAIGRYTPYSQVRTPPSGKYRTEDAERYYRHAKVNKM